PHALRTNPRALLFLPEQAARPFEPPEKARRQRPFFNANHLISHGFTPMNTEFCRNGTQGTQRISSQRSLRSLAADIFACARDGSCAPRVKLRVAQERRETGRFFAPGAFQFPRGAERLPSAAYRDSTRRCACCLRDKTRNRELADAAATRGASCDRDEMP